MKKTLLALVLGSVAASSFAYINLFSSADGRSKIRFGGDFRVVGQYQDNSFYYPSKAGSDEFYTFNQLRYRFSLDGHVFLNPETYLGFYTRFNGSFTNYQYTYTGSDTNANFRNSTRMSYKTDNGSTKVRYHNQYSPDIDRFQVYFGSYKFGRVTLALNSKNMGNQEVGAADNNDFSTATNFVYTFYTALSNVYLRNYDWTVRYDLTTDPNAKYLASVSYARGKSDIYSTQSSSKYKYNHDVQVSFGYKFNRQNGFYLNAASTAEATNTRDKTATKSEGVELYADVRPIPEYNNLRLRTAISTMSQNHRSWNYKIKVTSFSVDLTHYDTFVKGLNLYAGGGVKLDKRAYATYNTTTKTYQGYAGGEYYILNTYTGDKVTLKGFLEGLYSREKRENWSTNRSMNSRSVAAGFRLFL
ncbi:hypothetical protein [Psittacicella hinzii]|uniref:Uncharacterized protein n=1 Tax=Psittacicella hinzii TaxID=2028575 RepID=A0A3A1YTV0_9GAMM|nr:hypothetical protein [Psittacicella hinzii]RIY39854.1 hypothetical protein CKF58_01425 [Psittacicella hinzii]